MKNYVVTTIITIMLLGGFVLAQSRTNTKNLNEGLNDLSQQISNDLSDNQKQRIAVVEFVDLKGNVTDFGRYLSEKLITKLFQTKKFRVVERQLLNKIITEQKLSLTGIIDPATAQKLGKLLGVDAIAAGSISDLTKTLEINARLISTETGEVFSAASVEILKDETVCNLIGDCNSNVGNDNRGRTNINPTPNKPKSWVVKSNLFTFELLGCNISGDVIVCNLNITNNGDDRNLKIYFDTTKLYDDLGNEYKPSNVSFGNAKFDMGGLLSGGGIKGTIVSGIKTSGKVSFNKVLSNATKIALLNIEVSDGNAWFNVQFRNIPL